MQNVNQASGSCPPTYSQKGKQLLVVDGYFFYYNKTYTPKNGGLTKLYWQCERRKDLGCCVTAITDAKHNIVKPVANDHIHSSHNGMCSILIITIFGGKIIWSDYLQNFSGDCHKNHTIRTIFKSEKCSASLDKTWTN